MSMINRVFFMYIYLIPKWTNRSTSTFMIRYGTCIDSHNAKHIIYILYVDTLVSVYQLPLAMVMVISIFTLSFSTLLAGGTEAVSFCSFLWQEVNRRLPVW